MKHMNFSLIKQPFYDFHYEGILSIAKKRFKNMHVLSSARAWFLQRSSSVAMCATYLNFLTFSFICVKISTDTKSQVCCKVENTYMQMLARIHDS